MVKLQLDEKQAQVLLQLINIAVRAEGLNAAEAGSFFAKQIQDQLQKEEKEEVEREDVK